ncbi:hypothetical protein DFJ58DRAFT_728198 [Suillus subalutaceus]|uniref:uncharacterized protein n=1 Tax=Suillus subalutaceus TaxID=48586 RepID=UPI001B880CFC|nr:uncharacterized protein DFJ58DRAFT_728198 [Suillus subalutaceus]KAG1853449.1 hypothetical protein DFJ58DRAFT_728198 [Suillus subalutaceus]
MSVVPGTGGSHQPSPFTSDPAASRPSAPAPLQDMFYGSIGEQPAWSGQQASNMFDLMGPDSLKALLEDQGPGPSGFIQGFSGEAPLFDLQHPPHFPPLEPQPSPNADTCTLAPPPSTNIIPPTLLKDADTRTLTPGPSQQLDLSHYSPAAIVNERFPEEAEELPVVGRRSAETNTALDAGFTTVDQTLLELSRSTMMPVHQVLNLFMKSRGCNTSSINYWNLYSNYFKDNSKQELTRLGQNIPADEHTPNILDTHDELTSLGGLPHTVSQRAQAFQRLHRRVTNILDIASTKFSFKSAIVMCGKVVNQDASLGHVHMTPGATDFFLTRCCADNDTIIGHLKAQVYNTILLSTVEGTFMDNEDDDVAFSKDVDSKDVSSNLKDMEDHASDQQEGREEKGREDNIKWIKREITKQVAMCGGKLGTVRMFPWKLMPSTLADDNVCIKGYPAHNCVLPGDTRGVTSQSKSKGVASLTQKEVTILVEALKAKTMYVEKVSITKQAAVIASEILVIIGEAPPSDYPHAGARRLFIDGHMDHNGLPRLKASSATTKVKKSTTAGKSYMHPEVLLPPPSRPFKVVPRPPACEVIEVRSTSSDSQDEHGQLEPASESEYEDASHGKRKKRKPSGELHASKKCASPIDIPKAVKIDIKPLKEKMGPSSQGPIASPTNGTKGSPSSPLMVESSGDERDTPTGTNTNNAMCLRDGPSNKAEDTKGCTKARPAVKGSHPKGRLSRAIRVIYSDETSDGESIKPPSPKPTPVNIEDSAVSSHVDTPAETTEGPVQLQSSNTETNSVHTLPPREGDVVGDVDQVAVALQQPDGPSAMELPPLPQRGGGGDSQDLPANTHRQREESAHSQDSFNPKVRDPREPDHFHHHQRNYPFYGSRGPFPPNHRGPFPPDPHIPGRGTQDVSYPDYQHLHPHGLYHRSGNSHENPPEHYDTHNPARDLSPVAESSRDYSVERERGRLQANSDHDRYSPTADYGYMCREYGYLPRDNFDDCGHGFPPQHSRAYYPDPHGYGTRHGYTADSRWAGRNSRSPYYGPSPNSSSQAGPSKAPPA